jgi:hypothetical protein
MRGALVLALTLVAVPAMGQQPTPAPPAQAQAGPATSTCDVQIDTARRSFFRQVPGGYYDTFGWSGVWAHCREQPTTMYSDSVAWYPERDLLYLVGHVRFRDSTTMLDADQVTYYLRQEWLHAQGHVFTRNLRTGSDLRGSNLDYYRVAPSVRDTVELFAKERPTIRFFPANRTSPRDTEPFLVVADRTHMRGNDEMWGGGNVTVNRSDLAARGDSAWLDLGRDAAQLIGHPEVNGTGPDAYHLRGDLITFGLTPQHEIRRVLSSGKAAAHGPDWSLDADTIELALDSSKVQRAQAWGHDRRPDAVSGTHTIVADSLDIHMPGQLVRLVWAWGHARMVTHDSTARGTAADSLALARADSATAAARDTTARRVPARDTLAGGGPARRDTAVPARRAGSGPAAGAGGSVIARSALVNGDDWLLGDSLRADFVVHGDSAGGKPKSELEHLTSYGSASALYHVEPADSAAVHGRRGVNYSRGDRIDIATSNAKVQTVDVVGKVDGLYLEPVPPPDTTHHAGADSTEQRADSTRAAADTARARGGAPRPGGASAADPTRRRATPARPRPSSDQARRP